MAINETSYCFEDKTDCHEFVGGTDVHVFDHSVFVPSAPDAFRGFENKTDRYIFGIK